MLKKVISGGQTGVDQAALRAAFDLGYETGGWAPKGWLTEDGPNSGLRIVYGLEEASQSGYPYRTEVNIINSDGTLVISDMSGAGSKLTYNLCIGHEKPRMAIDPFNDSNINAVRDWLHKRSIATLNVAGSRESSRPGIGEWAYEFLLEALLPF